jgi:hypothetical protein
MNHFNLSLARRCLAALLIGLAPAVQALGTQDQDSLLDLREKFVQLKLARSKLAQMEPLAHQGIISRSDFEQHKSTADVAEIRFQRAALDMMNGEPRVTIERAVKLKDEQGQQFLELTLRNATQVLDDSQRALIGSLDKDGDFPRELWQRRLLDVFISVREAPSVQEGLGQGGGGYMTTGSQVAIALPYTSRIASWPFNEARTLRFKLLVNAERFNIHINHRSSEKVIGIYAEQQFSGADVELNASRVSQEANLGTAVEYPIEIRRGSHDSQTLDVQAYNLPPGVRYSFVERDGKNRVSQIRLNTGETGKALLLRVELPERAGPGLKLDDSQAFLVVVGDTARSGPLPPPGAQVSAETFKGQSVALTELKLTTRGVGKPVLNAASLVQEVKAGEGGRLEFTIKNEGTRSIENLRFDSERPAGFDVRFEPSQIEQIPVGGERKVSVGVQAASDMAAGDFELRVKTEGYSAAQALGIEDKAFRLVVKPSTTMLPMLIVGMLLLGATTVIVYVGQKVRLR